MYQTKQKKQIVEFFKNNMSRQLSVNEIISELCPSNAAGKSTVYRIIAQMVENKTLIRLHGDDGKNIVYQYVGEETACDEHFHLKCSDCGKLIHLDCEHLGRLGTHILDEHKFTIDTKKTVFYGTCNDCKTQIK